METLPREILDFILSSANHELNNVLTALGGYARQIAKKDASAVEKHEACLDRASQVVRSIRIYSGRDAGIQNVEIAQKIEDCLAAFRPKLKLAEIELRTTVPSGILSFDVQNVARHLAGFFHAMLKRGSQGWIEVQVNAARGEMVLKDSDGNRQQVALVASTKAAA